MKTVEKIVYICGIDSETKQLNAEGKHFTIVKGEQYPEDSDVVRLFPRLFFKKRILEEIPEPKAKSKPKVKTETPKKPRKKKVQPEIVPEPQPEPIPEKQGKIAFFENKLKDLLSRTEKPIKEELLPEIKEETKFKKYFRLLIILLSIVSIVSISVYLRAHGIAEMFKISLDYSLAVVGAFILSEFAIANIMLSEIKSRMHKALNFLVLGGIQLVLIGIAFTFEFSALSNILMSQKNDVQIVDDKKELLNNKLKDINYQISIVQKQIDLTPEDRKSEQKRLMSKMLKFTNEKNTVTTEIQGMLDNNQSAEKMKNRTGLENASTALGVNQNTLLKTIVFALAGILNVLYLGLMYSFVRDLKKS